MGHCRAEEAEPGRHLSDMEGRLRVEGASSQPGRVGAVGGMERGDSDQYVRVFPEADSHTPTLSHHFKPAGVFVLH